MPESSFSPRYSWTSRSIRYLLAYHLSEIKISTHASNFTLISCLSTVDNPAFLSFNLVFHPLFFSSFHRISSRFEEISPIDRKRTYPFFVSKINKPISLFNVDEWKCTWNDLYGIDSKWIDPKRSAISSRLNKIISFPFLYISRDTPFYRDKCFIKTELCTTSLDPFSVSPPPSPPFLLHEYNYRPLRSLSLYHDRFFVDRIIFENTRNSTSSSSFRLHNEPSRYSKLYIRILSIVFTNSSPPPDFPSKKCWHVVNAS